MKKALFFALLLIGFTISSCSKKCDGCGIGGVCDSGTCVCLNGYEGENCDIESNAKFLGSYNTAYTGTGGLSQTDDVTTMTITRGANSGKIQITIPLNLNANVPLAGNVELPFNISIQADVRNNTYNITKTVIGFNVPAGLLPLPIPIAIDINFEGDGTLNGNILNSTWVFSGFISGNLNMVGTR
jgi:hypothetical protein